MHLVVGRRLQGRQFLTAHGEVAQGGVIGIGGKLIAHLRGDEGVRDALLIEIVIQLGQVEPDVLTYYIYGGSARERGIHVHHRGVKAVAGVCRHTAVCREVVVSLVPMAECHQIAVLQHYALRHARGAGGVEEDEEGGGK